MGTRKRDSAIARKEASKDIVKASLNNCPSSPRKMRLVADIIRGEKVDEKNFKNRTHNFISFSNFVWSISCLSKELL